MLDQVVAETDDLRDHAIQRRRGERSSMKARSRGQLRDDPALDAP